LAAAPVLIFWTLDIRAKISDLGQMERNFQKVSRKKKVLEPTIYEPFSNLTDNSEILRGKSKETEIAKIGVYLARFLLFFGNCTDIVPLQKK